MAVISISVVILEFSGSDLDPRKGNGGRDFRGFCFLTVFIQIM
jgi:hypothetical protein